MPVGAYSQDLVTHIVNVQWGGGGFVAADDDGNVFFLKLGAATEPTWENLGTLDFAKEEGDMFTGWPQGSACASVDGKPVFVLVGGGGNVRAIGIIMASRDGKNWSRVFSYGEDSETYTGATIFGAVWNEDEKTFYAGGHQSDNFEDFEASVAWMSETDILFKSSDGFSWSEAGRHQMRVDSDGREPFPPWPEYKSGLLSQHCSPQVKDSNGSNVPGGVYGYDKSEKTLIAPKEVSRIDYLFGVLRYGDETGVDVTFSGEGVPPSYPSDTAIPTSSVATVGGNWVAAGGKDNSCQAAILTSREDGTKFWKRQDPPGTRPIVTMCGGA